MEFVFGWATAAVWLGGAPPDEEDSGESGCVAKSCGVPVNCPCMLLGGVGDSTCGWLWWDSVEYWAELAETLWPRCCCGE